MILSFSKEFPWGEPTNFVEKIQDGRKVHTIRQDPHKRWREGMKIHFATGVRTKDYNQFYEDECRSVQDVFIEPRLKVVCIRRPEIEESVEKIGLARIYTNIKAKEIALNDGFDSEDDFWKWFDEPFSGRLIHWTDLTY